MNISWRTAAGLAGLGVLVVGFALGWAGRGFSTYHTNVATVGSYYDWRTACPSAEEKEASCQMVEDVIDQKNPNHPEIARVAILREKGNLVMGITMPYDVLLQPGLGLVIGTSPQKTFPYRTCNTVGCLVVIPMDKNLNASLRGAQAAHLVFAGLDSKPISVDFSVKGYDTAQSAFEREEAKRTSWFWRMWS